MRIHFHTRIQSCKSEFWPLITPLKIFRMYWTRFYPHRYKKVKLWYCKGVEMQLWTHNVGKVKGGETNFLFSFFLLTDYVFNTSGFLESVTLPGKSICIIKKIDMCFLFVWDYVRSCCPFLFTCPCCLFSNVSHNRNPLVQSSQLKTRTQEGLHLVQS